MFQTDAAPWLYFRAWNSSDNSPKTDLVFNTAGISIVVVRNNLANSAALTLSAASSPTDWAAGKFIQVNGNLYRVGIATASISGYVGAISVQGSYTGGTLDGIVDNVEVPPLTTLGTNAPAGWLNTAAFADSALNGKGDWNTIAPDNATIGLIYGQTTYLETNQGTLTSSERSTLAGVVDAQLLNAGDATDLIASIVSRIGNTNIDQASLAAAVKAALFNSDSITYKLAVDSLGRVSIAQAFPDNFAALGINSSGHVSRVTVADSVTSKTGYSLATAPPTADAVATAVWSNEDRTLSSFGTLVTDITTSIWGNIVTGSTSAATALVTLLTRITGVIRTKDEDTTAETNFARKEDVQVTVTPTINVTPTEVSPESVTLIQAGLATSEELDDVLGELLGAIGGIDGTGGPGLTGPYTVTITVVNNSLPVPGALVRLFRSGESESKRTNSEGIVIFTVNTNTWSYAISSPGFNGTTGSIVVSSTNISRDVTLTLRTQTTPSEVGLCVVGFEYLSGRGTPLADLTIKAKLVARNVTTVTDSLLSDSITTATTNSLGIANLELVQRNQIVSDNKKYRIEVWTPDLRNKLVSIETEIPDADNVTFAELVNNATIIGE